MKNPTRRIWLVTLILSLPLEAGRNAQARHQDPADDAPPLELRSADGPVRTGTLRLRTSEWIPGDEAEKSAALAPVFVNIDDSGFYGVGALVNTQTDSFIEWMDWGVVPGDSGSRVVGEFTFGYGTSVTDTNLGGPGAHTLLRFYDGITGFCADSGTAPTASFSFTGLPGSSPGGGAVWVVTVDLVGGFEFLHAGTGQPFGFGFTTFDDYDQDLNRETGPLLCYAGDPNGPNNSATQDPDENGQVDVFDQWDDSPRSNLCLGSFFFGGTPFNFVSWFLVLESAVATPTNRASVTVRNGTGANPLSYATASTPVLGSAFASTDARTRGGIGSFVVGYATPLTLATRFGELLVDPSDPGGPLLAGVEGPYPFDASGVAAIAYDIPTDLRLCGFSIATQAFEFGNGIQLKNALDLVLGF